MPLKESNRPYVFEKYQINGKDYQIPNTVQPGSRRWRMWIYVQNLGLKLPKNEPDGLDIQPHGVVPYVPFAVYEKHLQAA